MEWGEEGYKKEKEERFKQGKGKRRRTLPREWEGRKDINKGMGREEGY